jgi:hypothetical protein
MFHYWPDVHVNRVSVHEVREEHMEKVCRSIIDHPRSSRSEVDLLRPRRREGIAPVFAGEPLEHVELALRRRLATFRDHERKVILRRVVRRCADDDALPRGVRAVRAREEDLVRK